MCNTRDDMKRHRMTEHCPEVTVDVHVCECVCHSNVVQLQKQPTPADCCSLPNVFVKKYYLYFKKFFFRQMRLLSIYVFIFI